MNYITTDHSSDTSDARRYAPATKRNRQAIFDVLEKILPKQGRLLEIASGTGEHAAWLAPQFHPLVWQTSEFNQELFPSIKAHIADANSDNLLAPLHIDVTKDDWGIQKDPDDQKIETVDVITCANMIHIAPWQAAEGLFQGASKYLKEGGLLLIYGPFYQADIEAAPSNISFDQGLRLKDSSWGIRKLEEIKSLAETVGLHLHHLHQMPANNLYLQFHKSTTVTP